MEKKHKLKEEILTEGDKNFEDGSFDMKSFFFKKSRKRPLKNNMVIIYYIF